MYRMDLKEKKLIYGIILLLTIIYIYVYNQYTQQFSYQNLGYAYRTQKPVLKYNLKPNSTLHNKTKLINHTHWIVVTTIAEPTEDLKILVNISGWKVVVVGDEKTPSNWSLTGAVFLSVDDQMQLGYQMTAQLPVNSYTRKMIGYLYAIQNGAKYIYDTDDDNHPAGGSIDFHLKPTMTGLVYDDLSRSTVNPLAHFGESELWPRGYPLQFISIEPSRDYQLCTFKTPAIQQGLVNGDPDVDAIYRLINRGSSKGKNINITFDHHSPPMTIPTGVFAPFNSQNTLFAYDAFWALFLPTTVAFRVTDIWRGYWAQPLLWLIGQRLAFFPPNAVQFRNAHNYLKDFTEELQIYEQVGALIELLSSWKCDLNLKFFQCVMNLTNEMSKHNFLKNDDVSLTEMWLQDLMAVGYREPHILAMANRSQPETSNWVHYSPPQHLPNGFQEVMYICTNDNKSRSVNRFQNLNPNKIHKPSYVFENILLVIVFNYPIFLENVRTLEALYRDHFPNILFCSEANGYSELMKMVNLSDTTWRNNDISFVNLTSPFQGWYGYECAIRAIETSYKVDGYMFLGDDVLLKPWKLQPFNFQHSRIENDTYGPYTLQNRHNDTCSSKIWESWWARTCGKNATNNALDEIEQISLNDTDGRSEMFKKYISNRFANGVNMTLISYSMSDFYYISKRDAAMFTEIIKIFHKHQVYVDIAVPTTLVGCREGDPQTGDGFPGNSVWWNDRNAPLNFFTNDSVYVHPLKLKEINGNPNLLESYCADFVDEYLRTW